MKPIEINLSILPSVSEVKDLKSLLDTKIIELLEAMGIKLLSFTEAQSIFTFNESDLACAGLYNCWQDLIAINDIKLHDDLSEVILHELTHWTAHPTRLNRNPIADLSRSFTNRKIGSYCPSYEDFCAEEAVAQMGMYKLSQILGFDEFNYRVKLYTYLSRFPVFDMAEAERNSDIAVEYIMQYTKKTEAA